MFCLYQHCSIIFLIIFGGKVISRPSNVSVTNYISKVDDNFLCLDISWNRKQKIFHGTSGVLPSSLKQNYNRCRPRHPVTNLFPSSNSDWLFECLTHCEVLHEIAKFKREGWSFALSSLTAQQMPSVHFQFNYHAISVTGVIQLNEESVLLMRQILALLFWMIFYSFTLGFF
jgi:hypothetical protein